MSAFAPLARALAAHDARYVLIGVWGANFHAHRGGVVFSTQDWDLFMPPEPANLLATWNACRDCGLAISSAGQPLDQPMNHLLAERVIEQLASTQASDDELQVDLTLVMAGLDFDSVWDARTRFVLDRIEIPVARLRHIIDSKAATGRDKDRLFLATHEENL
ncbi:MAG: hypothetical protein ACI8Y8_003530, partial [Planctomycetota bacterium]